MEVPKVMNLTDFQDRFAELAPAGCYIALRLGFYAPEAELNLFSAEWIDHYTLSGYALADPFLLWCQKSEGHVRWSAFESLGLSKVLLDYHRFGHSYGGVISVQGTPKMPKRSLGVFARNDREFTDAELAELDATLRKIHSFVPQALTEPQIAALRLYSRGILQKQIAYELQISVTAVKGRLRGAADRLGVKTLREAAHVAASRGLL
ncbi:LuxR family transcriptional regulator [Thioclava dalianensis]|nr:LuxR family transcriptional regulator [Thioclava dalianensis]